MNVPAPGDTLASWLGWLEALHPSEIELGLERVRAVAERAGLLAAEMPVILVGGTNGKGSTVALLADIYRRAGYVAAAYTSPHIDTFNERMRIDGRMLEDSEIISALEHVESVRAPESLTYFEFTTLAAMQAFRQARCDVVVLEVGLGGRLDATNIWDPDCAVLTSIALDHEAWLGNDRDAIAREKVAIGRPGKPMIVGEPDPPAVLAEHARLNDFALEFIDFDNLPESALPGVHQQRNAACAVAAVAALQAQLPVPQAAVRSALQELSIAGRFERLQRDGLQLVMDVAHNPAAAQSVADTLQSEYPGREVYVLFSALADKDVSGVVAALANVVAGWYLAPLSVARAASLDQLRQQVVAAQGAPVQAHASIADAWTALQRDLATASALNGTEAPAVVLVAGSFYTLSELRSHFRELDAAGQGQHA